jgi:hypothetical protein
MMTVVFSSLTIFAVLFDPIISPLYVAEYGAIRSVIHTAGLFSDEYQSARHIFILKHDCVNQRRCQTPIRRVFPE